MALDEAKDGLLCVTSLRSTRGLLLLRRCTNCLWTGKLKRQSWMEPSRTWESIRKSQIPSLRKLWRGFRCWFHDAFEKGGFWLAFLFCGLISGGVQNFRGLEAACGQLGDELRVGGKKIVVAKLLRQDPFDAFERCWDGLSFQDGNGKEANFQFFWCAGIFVLHTGHLHGLLQRDAQLLFQFAREGYVRRFSLFDFSAGELPLEGRSIVGPALADQQAAVASFNYRCDDDYHLRPRDALAP